MGIHGHLGSVGHLGNPFLGVTFETPYFTPSPHYMPFPYYSPSFTPQLFQANIISLGQLRPYPAIDISTFEHSVAAFQRMVSDAGAILTKFAEPQYARNLMEAAQMGNRQEVDRLIKSIGTSAPVTTQYTPTGVLLTIHAQAQASKCCTLTMYLRWGQ
ncbi:hypothetical protein RAC89_23855 [Paenibacillus sp. GD4]|uniref:hypothetical protein n=1 Tax=Paenibacillus sp. GD4 TaxID=3068890 RepID=UPI0027967BA2|nr:hypothetical protein [Paenibacillus sp. GD4]MDQ1913437.1 hypothetical protein [Paenibacillus sp. GD4]